MERKRKFCTKHSFYFRGVECPFCLKERVGRFMPKEEVEEERPITEIELNALVEKFNGKL